MNHRISCFKLTTDQWHSEFQIAEDGRHMNERFVHVSLIPLQDGTWRCCVWGNDDFGMEKDAPEREEAEQTYMKVCMLPNVRHSILMDMGFVRA